MTCCPLFSQGSSWSTGSSRTPRAAGSDGFAGLPRPPRGGRSPGTRGKAGCWGVRTPRAAGCMGSATSHLLILLPWDEGPGPPPSCPSHAASNWHGALKAPNDTSWSTAMLRSRPHRWQPQGAAIPQPAALLHTRSTAWPPPAPKSQNNNTQGPQKGRVFRVPFPTVHAPSELLRSIFVPGAGPTPPVASPPAFPPMRPCCAWSPLSWRAFGMPAWMCPHVLSLG